MIRKRTALFFILLANIVLLVHAVVPHHHHHKSLVCVESNHCQSDKNAHNHRTTAHDHEHDGDAGTECCVLKQAVVIPVSSLRQEFKCLGCDDNHSKLVHFQAILFVNKYLSFVPEVISIAQIPLKTSSHFWFVSTSSGLRAPPVV